MSKKKKIIIILVILVLIIGLYTFSKTKKEVADNQINIRTVELNKQNFENTITAQGKIESKSSTNITTSANYNVVSINVEVGDYVNEGDILVTLDTGDVNKEINRRKEGLQEELRQATNTKNDAWNAYEADNNSENEKRFATANYNYNKVLDALNGNDDNLKDLYEKLDDCNIKASQSGTVTELNATIGAPITGGNVATIADINDLAVTINVDEYDIQKISKGMKAVVYTDAVDGEFSATVKAVSLAAKTVNNNSSFEVKVELDEKNDQLLIGMNVKVKIILKEENDVYLVPIDAVETDENGNKLIYIQDENGNFSPLTIETGDYNDYYIVIKSSALKDGMQVRASVVEQETAANNSNSPLRVNGPSPRMGDN